jgi:hypothetical protein
MIEISVKGVGLSTSFSLISDSACACVRREDPTKVEAIDPHVTTTSRSGGTTAKIPTSLNARSRRRGGHQGNSQTGRCLHEPHH